jgi:glycosyltransferase involved in cell wall biosynthesis
MCLVSIVLPAYNAASTVIQTLRSALAQTYPDLEVIVVDDGSTDGTAEVAAGISDTRVRVLSVDNGGVSRARNIGIAQALGSYIAFLDADDIWRPEKLERQLAALDAHPDAGFCVTGGEWIGRLNEPLAARQAPIVDSPDPTEALLLHSMVVGYISSGLVRRTVLDQVGQFDPELSQTADWDLWLRLSLATTFAVIREPLMQYRIHPATMSSSIPLLERDIFLTLDKFFDRPDARRYRRLKRQVYGTQWLTCAGSYMHASSPWQTLRCLKNCLRIWPTGLSYAAKLPYRRLTHTANRPPVAR